LAPPDEGAHRREHDWLGIRIIVALPERIDPANLRKQPDNLTEPKEDTHDKNADNQAIETGIGGEEDRYLAK
jgi:hypothetical protein